MREKILLSRIKGLENKIDTLILILKEIKGKETLEKRQIQLDIESSEKYKQGLLWLDERYRKRKPDIDKGFG